MNDTLSQSQKYQSWMRKLQICHLNGFTSHGDWTKCQFKKNGIVYDLSAADVTRLNYIVENGSFIVK